MTAAAVANPGMAAWKTVVWNGEVQPGQSLLVLGATGAASRIATLLGVAHGAPRGNGRPLSFADAASGFAELGELVAAGVVDVPLRARRLAEVADAWLESDHGSRTVLVP